LQPLAAAFFLQLIRFERSEDVAWWITCFVVQGVQSCVADSSYSQACQRVKGILFFLWDKVCQSVRYIFSLVIIGTKILYVHFLLPTGIDLNSLTYIYFFYLISICLLSQNIFGLFC